VSAVAFPAGRGLSGPIVGNEYQIVPIKAKGFPSLDKRSATLRRNRPTAVRRPECQDRLSFFGIGSASI
jgi:hypothetical protein